MTPRCALLLPLALMACSEEPKTDKSIDAEPEETGDPVDDGPADPVHPTGDRILLYYGNGGYAQVGDAGGFSDFDDHIKTTLGWNTDHRSDWTEDLSQYRMIGLLALGHDGGENLSEDQIQALIAANAAGTRLVFMADVDSCGSTVMADAITRVGSSMGYTGEAPDPTYVAQSAGDDLSPNHQLTAGLSEVRFRAPCWVDAGGGSPISLASNGNAIVGTQLLDHGGEVIVMGDFGVIDDSGNFAREDLDNKLFGENLVKVDPTL